MNMFKKNGGFTLVELIVVIAILAILAGVAVPAYTGYLDKAKEASDTQVLSAINTAIQAATAVNEATPSASLASGKVSVTFTGTDAAKATADYNVYIGGNESAVLKYYDGVKMDGKLVVGTKGASATTNP